MTTERPSAQVATQRATAQQRHDLHKAHASSRPLSDGYEDVGVTGEFAFGAFCGLMPDVTARPAGDKGIDFRVLLRFSVDVKTARRPGHLIHEAGKPFADIFVLARYDDDTQQAELLGWEWGAKLKLAPIKDFGYGVLSHYIPAGNLRPMAELDRYIFRIGQE